MAVVPCFAVTDEYASTGTFWQALSKKWYLIGQLPSAIIGWTCDDVCSESSDHRHHGSLKTYDLNPDKSFTAVCNYCSAEFPVYDADLAAVYDNYVQTLPSTGYTSDGAILWHPTTADVQGYYYAPPLSSDFLSVKVLPSGISELDDKTGYKITGRYTRAVLRNSNKGANKVK